MMNGSLFNNIGNVLIAPGSFKDVLSSPKVCEMLENVLSESYSIQSIPMCDGGENTFEVLKKFYGQNAKIQYVNDVYNPYGRIEQVPYLIINGKAFIVSSEILHLNNNEDCFMNPLDLTDYGLGQLIKDAIKRSIKEVFLCLGGTSTIGYGLGVAQALGCEFFDISGRKLKAPIRLSEYNCINSIYWNDRIKNDVSMTVINDGITKGIDLDRVNPLKIGRHFSNKKRDILSRVDSLFSHVCQITGLSAYDPFSGNGGGIYYGIHNIFNPKYVKGSDFFCEIFNLENLIAKADLVITGEGRFDNPDLEKIPIAVSKMAKKHCKPVVYVCGLIGHEMNLSGRGITQNDYYKKEYGIDVILSCEEDYDPHIMEQYYLASDYYIQYSPIILKERFSQIGVKVK